MLDYNARVRQLWRALQGVPQLLLVQPEQLSYDLAYALALLPLVVAGIVFFLQDALLLFALSFLAGIVCLLAIQLARLTFGLPAWIGFRATHPLVASILIASFFSPRTPAWVAATMVILFIVIDTVLWPQLQRVMLHPALIIFGLLFLIDRQLGIGFANPFDGRHLDDLRRDIAGAEPAVDHADPALFCESHGHGGSGNRVHVGRHDWAPERNLAGELTGEIDDRRIAAGHDAKLRRQQEIVERAPLHEAQQIRRIPRHEWTRVQRPHQG